MADSGELSVLSTTVSRLDNPSIGKLPFGLQEFYKHKNFCLLGVIGKSGVPAKRKNMVLQPENKSFERMTETTGLIGAVYESGCLDKKIRCD